MRTVTVRVGELYPDQTMEEAIDILKMVRSSIQNLIGDKLHQNHAWSHQNNQCNWAKIIAEDIENAKSVG